MPHSSACLILLALLAYCGNGPAKSQNSSPNLCSGISLADSSLTLQKCDSNGNIIYATYKGKESDSPYATEFDEKKLIVAISNNKSDLMNASGFYPESSKLKFDKTKLDVIPSPEQISSRKVSKPIEKNGWIINREDIQYFDPKGSGYIISCATALKYQEGNSIAVSECLPYGQLDEFIELLRNLHTQ